MINIFSGSDMKKIDAYTIENVGIPSLVLMERAALCVCDVIEDNVGTDASVLIVCGTGNNGADGLAVARIIYNRGYKVSTYILGEIKDATCEFIQQKNINDNLKIECCNHIDFDRYNVIVDAIFGVGLSRKVEGRYEEIINEINTNKEGKKIFAIDAPSGVNCDDGHIEGTCVFSDCTITFGVPKTGLLLYPATEACGKIVVSDIGFPKEAYENVLQNTDKRFFTYEREDLQVLKQRPEHSNKGTFGKLLVVAGSEGMSGAAYMCAKAAMRTGCGMTKIFTVSENLDVLAKKLPEAMISIYEACNPDIDKLAMEINWADAIVIGPGLGKPENVELIVGTVLMSGKPVVIDADGLNAIASCDELKGAFHDKCIITPHPGEMARLTKMSLTDILSDLVKTAEDYTMENNVVCVLKDARTIVSSNEKVYINLTGNSGMATAGSGDVLAGIIGGLLARGVDVSDAAAMGVYIHGLSGDEAADVTGKNAMLATDIIDGISKII